MKPENLSALFENGAYTLVVQKDGAICFSLPVSSVAGLRERDEG